MLVLAWAGDLVGGGSLLEGGRGDLPIREISPGSYEEGPAERGRGKGPGKGSRAGCARQELGRVGVPRQLSRDDTGQEKIQIEFK